MRETNSARNRTPPSSDSASRAPTETSHHAITDGRVTKTTRKNQAKKRRRAEKKIVAAEDMAEMKDALPEISDDSEEEVWFSAEEGLPQDAETSMSGKKRKRKSKDGDGKIRMRSLKHRPGAMKRKRKMEGKEIERFGRNLAQMAPNTKAQTEGAGRESGKGAEGEAGGGGGASSKEKWAALRAFIGSTMETKGEFKKL